MRWWLALVAAGLIASSCHLVTGATEYRTGDDDDEGGEGGSAGANTGGNMGGGDPMACMGQHHWECPADQVCINNECVIGWGRTFHLTIVNASITDTNPVTMQPWDDEAVEAPGEAPPDPKFTVSNNGTVIHAEMYQLNTYTPAWNTTVDVVLEQGGPEISIAVFDDDTNIIPAVPDDLITGQAADHQTWLDIVRDQVSMGSATTDFDGIFFTTQIDAF